MDPAAPAHPRLVCGSVEQAAELSKFDAVVAVMALHHAELDAVTSAIAGLLRPRGRLFVYDFDWSAYDDRAAASGFPSNRGDFLIADSCNFAASSDYRTPVHFVS